jgi:peptide/nickel transport system substrate-binding protein
VIKDPVTEMAAFKAGEIDFIASFSPEHVDTLRAQNPKAHIMTGKETTPMVAQMKVTVPKDGKPMSTERAPHPIFGDLRVRKAIGCYGIDRQEIVKIAFKGQATPWVGMAPPGTLESVNVNHLCPYDQAKAKALLQQAGYANEEIVIESQRNVLLDNEQQVCETVVAMWKAVGVNAKLEIVEPAVRAEKNRLRNYKGCFTSYFTSVLGDPDGFMWRTLQTGGGLNYGVANDEFNRLGKEANTSLDQALRMKNYQRMNDIYLDELPTFAIIEATLGFGLQKYINFKAGPVTSVDFRKENLSFS